MEKTKPTWKHKSVFMTVSCFIAHQLGSHSRMIKMVLKIAIIAAAVYGLLRLTEISIEIKRADTLFLKI